MSSRAILSIGAAGTLMLALAGCGQSANSEGDATTPSMTSVASESSSAAVPSASSSVPAPSGPVGSGQASGGWAAPDAVEAAKEDAIETIAISGRDGAELHVALDAVEYSRGPSGKIVAALAFTLTPAGDLPVELGAPIEGEDWVYATSPDGNDAESFYQMGQDYSEDWVGHEVDPWHRGPFMPGTSYQVLETIPIDKPGGYIARVTGEGHMVGPIELPADDTGLPNAQIERAHEIVDDLGNSDMLLTQ